MNIFELAHHFGFILKNYLTFCVHVEFTNEATPKRQYKNKKFEINIHGYWVYLGIFRYIFSFRYGQDITTKYYIHNSLKNSILLYYISSYGSDCPCSHALGHALGLVTLIPLKSMDT